MTDNDVSDAVPLVLIVWSVFYTAGVAAVFLTIELYARFRFGHVRRRHYV